MTGPDEETTVTDQSQPTATTKKATAKKATRRAGAKASTKRVILMVGASRGAEHGDRRIVDADRAAELVESGLATYAGGE